jgi:hypothetical protein
LRETALGDDDWERANIIFVPIFLGPEDSGHWAALVIDRRNLASGLFSFADSLSTSARTRHANIVYETLQNNTPLVSSDSVWAIVNMTSQAIGSNDCCVFMPHYFSAYLKVVVSDKANMTPSPSTILSASVRGLTPASAFCARGRINICQSIRQKDVSFSNDTIQSFRIDFGSAS